MESSVNPVSVWLSIGACLVVLEMMTLSGILLMLGIGFMATALASWILNPSLEWQMLILAVSLVTTYGLWAKFRSKIVLQNANDELSPDKELIGKQFILHMAIDGGKGEIKIQDALYTVYGEEMPAGETVRILCKDGMAYRVERVS